MSTQNKLAKRFLLLIVILTSYWPGTSKGQNIQLDNNDPRLSGIIANPVICPAVPNLIAFERAEHNSGQVFILNYNRHDPDARMVLGLRQKHVLTAWKGIEGIVDEGLANFSTTQLDWRPVLDQKDRQWFAYVFSLRPDSSTICLSFIDKNGKLTEKPSVKLDLAGTNKLPKWSPDGNDLVYVNGEGDDSDLYLLRNICETILCGQQPDPILLTTNPENDSYPSWSPDGHFIAYQATEEENGLLNTGINLIEVDKFNRGPFSSIRLTRDGYNMFHEYKPTWSPDGEYIAFYMTQKPITEFAREKKHDIGIVQITNRQRNGLARTKKVDVFRSRVALGVQMNRISGPEWAYLDGQLMLIYTKEIEENKPLLHLRNVRKKLEYNTKHVGAFEHTYQTEVDVSDMNGFQRFVFVAKDDESTHQLVVKDFKDGAAGLPVVTHSRCGCEERQRPPMIMAVIPGARQFWGGDKVKGAAIGLAGAASAIYYFAMKNRFDDAMVEYDRELASYQQTFSPDYSAIREFEQAQQAHRRVSREADRTNIAGAFIIGVVTLNLIDQFIMSKDHESTPRNARYTHSGIQLRTSAQIATTDFYPSIQFMSIRLSL